MRASGMEQKGLDFGGSETPRTRRRGLTVSQLTERIQGALEADFFDVWVEGEISNLSIAPSGHWYFSLKDDRAQLRAVVFKTATRLIRFRPKDGMKVLVRGGIRVYPPRGEYQISVEAIEPLGKGALQQAFEELKERLSKEGLFDSARKRPLPMLPRVVGVVTSPTGAVIQDMLRILSRHYANLSVLIYPVRVQGPEAAGEIAQGVRILSRLPGIDVLVVARGGGSLEDLWPFNEEAVARALSSSPIPTISAVGHETDVTIADFVADLRAPTPSAAALRVVEAKQELRARIDALSRRMGSALNLGVTRVRARVTSLTSHRVFEAERGRLRRHAQHVHEMVHRGGAGLGRNLERQRQRLRHVETRLEGYRWDRQVASRRQVVGDRFRRLHELASGRVASRRLLLGNVVGRLESLSPLSVLSRGYALVWDPDGNLLRRPDQVQVGDPLRIRVHEGLIEATVASRSRREPGSTGEETA
jgi:exodeoxyribonuclease VII large subunit